MPRRNYSTQLLGTLQPNVRVGKVVFSHDGRSVAYEATHLKRSFIIHQDVKLREFDRVSDLQFSPDNLELVYVGVDHYKQGYWQDEFDLREYCHLMHGEQEGRAFARITQLTFDASGKRLAYVAQEKDEAQRLVVDEKPGKRYQQVRWPAFSPDGKHLAYMARTADGCRVVLNGREGRLYEDVRYLRFSPDGEVAFTARQDGKWRVVIGDTEWEEYDYAGCPAFSPDGHILAFKASEGQFEFMRIGGGRGPAFKAVGTYAWFSPDGRHIAYEVHLPTGGSCILTDALQGTRYDAVSDWLVWSPDSRIHAHGALIGGKHHLVMGDQLSPPLAEVLPPVFSADGRHIACAVRQGRQWWMLLDHALHGPYDAVAEPVFSGNGKKLCFGARLGQELWWTVIETVD